MIGLEINAFDACSRGQVKYEWVRIRFGMHI